MNQTLVREKEIINMEPLGLVKVEARPETLTEEAATELNLWDEEGRAIVEQIINRFPQLFPYTSKN